MDMFLAPRPKQVVFEETDYKPTAGTYARQGKVLPSVFAQQFNDLVAGWAPVLDYQVQEGLVDVPMNAEHAYYLAVSTSGILIKANTPIGALYALQTLKQLKKGKEGFACCEILDYPDVEWRVGARALLCGEGCRSALDWGDGREGFIKRWKFEIDYALSCKYNGIFCYGMRLDTDIWEGYAADMRMLNHYALERGVRLIYSIYGISFGGWGGEGYLGAAHAFVPGAGHEVAQEYICGINNPAKPETGKNGTCRSNQALWEQKVKDVHRFIEAIHPGGIYIHHEDISSYHLEWELFWKLRCDECRKQWPNDAADAIDGGAGAIAHGYEAFCEARKGIRADSYDAERDCSLWLTSPCYGESGDSDESWGHLLNVWSNVARVLKTRENVYLTIREQYPNDNGTLRVKELTDVFKAEHLAPKLMLFSVGGAALYGENASFSSMPELNSFFEGASGVFNFSGVLYQRPQQLFNSECTWNLMYREGGETMDVRGVSRQDVIDLLIRTDQVDSAVEERHQKPDGWLAKACKLIYGEKAGECIWNYLLLRTEYNGYPLSIVFKHAMMDRVMDTIKGPFPQERKRAGLRWKRPLDEEIDYWEKLDILTGKGMALIQQAAAELTEGGLRDELQQQVATLAFGQIFCRVMADFFHHTKESTPEIKAKIMTDLASMRAKALAFPQNYLTDQDGETSLYLTYCQHLENMIKAEEA